MTVAPQPRASAITRRAITFALCSLSIATFAQPPAAQTPANTTPANSKTGYVTSGSPTKRQTQAAEDAYLTGARMLDRNDLAGAEIQFDKAVKLNPSNSDYANAYAVTHQRHITELVQESGKARLLGQNEKAETLLAEA